MNVHSYRVSMSVNGVVVSLYVVAADEAIAKKKAKQIVRERFGFKVRSVVSIELVEEP